MAAQPHDEEAVIGINFGNAYASIAVINKEGLADTIANEDGERQIACAFSFNGDEVYTGKEAKAQLVRNASNTIIEFRNLLGKSYSDLLEEEKKRVSCHVVDLSGQPGFRFKAGDAETTLTAQEVSTKFLGTLLKSAQDFLSGVKVTGAVLAVPFGWTDARKEALAKAAEDAGIKVLQIIPEAAAAAVAYDLTVPSPSASLPASGLDRNVIIVDVGGTSTDVSVLAARAGMYSLLSTVHEGSLGGRDLDDALVEFFSKEFTKKTKVQVAADNARAFAKLRLEVEAVKRALSASNSASCSIESLAEGIDFHTTINRMRFDLLATKVYGKIQEKIEQAVKEAGLEPTQVDEVLLVGGTSRLPGLVDRLSFVFPESISMTGTIESDEVIARGCALQAQLLASHGLDDPERKAFASTPFAAEKQASTSAPIGLVVPAAEGDARAVDGQAFVTIVPASTPLPARRIVELDVSRDTPSSVLLSLWEGKEEVKVDRIEPPPKEANGANGDEDEDEEEEEEEPEEVRTAVVRPITKLVELAVEVSGKEVPPPKLRVQIIVAKDGKVSVEAGQSGGKVEKAEF